MAIYAIGDIQGCYRELRDLLQRIQFQPHHDQLWFCGDLVNRGKNSLDVLRFIAQLPIEPVIVLGNHDLHLLAVASGGATLNAEDTFIDVLDAADCPALCDWLSKQKIFHYDEKLGYALCHAGIAPSWDLQLAIQCAQEVENVIREYPAADFYRNLYGNKPNCWSDDLCGIDRMRFIVNAYTRMRFCDAQGCLDFSFKGRLGEQPPQLLPWFEVSGRKTAGLSILFGHWAALEGKTKKKEFTPWIRDVSGEII